MHSLHSICVILCACGKTLSTDTVRGKQVFKDKTMSEDESSDFLGFREEGNNSSVNMPVNSEHEGSPTPGDTEMERMRLKLAVLEAQMKLMKAKEEERQRLGGSEQEPEQYFNITKAANFVPKFTESDPDRYFSFF